MFIILNILIIALVLLIAYWWANQGLFSAILHLVCVIVAGAVALAVWEPITLGLLMRGNMFDDFAWGASLIGVFAITLLILRVSLDKLVPGNVALPQSLNLGAGFVVGGAAGILTIGIFLIGAGFIQSTRELMGFSGMVRIRGTEIAEEKKLWLPVHTFTSEFYSLVSAGSLYPTFNNTPLRQYNPNLHHQAAALVRDSAPVKTIAGRGKLSLRPDQARIEEFIHDPDTNRYVIKVRFLSGARDFGEQLTLSSAQIRLIGAAREFAKPKVVHPDQWTQYDGMHRFDDVTHYITSEPGQAEATVLLEFPAAAFATPPRFIQIRNTRFRLPAPQQGVVSAARTSPIQVTRRENLDTSAPNIQSAIQLSNDINPVVASTNQKPPGIRVNDERFITGGEGEFTTGTGDRPSRSLMIQGIFEPDGTRIVQVNVSRESPANIFGLISDAAGPNARIVLVDTVGRTYQPIGYIHSRPGNQTSIKVDLQNYISSIRDIPPLPSAGGQPLRLLFSVTQGATIAGLKVGDITVGTCNLPVSAARGATPPPTGAAPPTAGSNPDDV